MVWWLSVSKCGAAAGWVGFVYEDARRSCCYCCAVAKAPAWVFRFNSLSIPLRSVFTRDLGRVSFLDFLQAAPTTTNDPSATCTPSYPTTRSFPQRGDLLLCVCNFYVEFVWLCVLVHVKTGPRRWPTCGTCCRGSERFRGERRRSSRTRTWRTRRTTLSPLPSCAGNYVGGKE